MVAALLLGMGGAALALSGLRSCDERQRLL